MLAPPTTASTGMAETNHHFVRVCPSRVRLCFRLGLDVGLAPKRVLLALKHGGSPVAAASGAPSLPTPAVFSCSHIYETL